MLSLGGAASALANATNRHNALSCTRRCTPAGVHATHAAPHAVARVRGYVEPFFETLPDVVGVGDRRRRRRRRGRLRNARLVVVVVVVVIIIIIITTE